MALIRAAATGNWSNTATWTGGVLPGAGDDVRTNNFVVTCDISPTVLSVSNRAESPAVAGGRVELANGVTLTCTGDGIIGGVAGAGAGAVTFSLGAGNSANVVADVVGNAISTGNMWGINNSGGGTLNVTGSVTGGLSNTLAYGINHTGVGITNITGSITGGTGGSSTTSHGVNLANNAGTVNITGPVAGGSNTVAGVVNNSTGTLTVVGAITAANSAPGIGAGNVGQVTLLSGPFYSNANAINPVQAQAWRWIDSPTPTFIEIRTSDLLATRTLYTADSVGGNPAANNVRLGTTYGPVGELTGTCAVPPAASVGVGVPVDNTVGTAAVTAEAIRAAVGLAAADLDAQIEAIAAKTDNLPSDPADQSAVEAAITAATTGLSTFDPATDTVANVTTVETVTNSSGGIDQSVVDAIGAILSLVSAPDFGSAESEAAAAAAITATPANLGTNAPANWLNAAAVQDGALTAAKFAAGAFDAVWSVATRTLTAIADSAGVTTLLGRLTSDRAGYLDKLNVSGTLAHTDNASTFRADVSALLTTTGYSSSLPANFGALAITEGGQVTTSNPGGGGATAAQIWEYTDRTLTGTQASNLAAIPAIPTNPLLTTDSRLGNLDAAISSRATPANVTDAQTAILNQGNSAWTTATGFSTLTPTDLATALTTYDVAKVADVQVTVDGGFESGDRTKLTKLYQRQHLDPSAPVTRTKAGDTVTETFDDVTITHATNGTDTVTSTRST